MSPETTSGVLTELAAALNDAIAAHGFASWGLRPLSDLISGLPQVPENPDPDIYLGIGDPNLPTSRMYATWKKSLALDQVAKDGPVEVRLSQQWVVYTYALRYESEALTP